MSIRKQALGFGAFAVVSVLVTVLVWNTLARTVNGATNTYTAVFTDVLGLGPNDDVRIAGVRVGKVTAIELTRGADPTERLAEVTFEVQRTQHLYTDTKALVRYQNLIGQRYLALAPGTAPDAHLLPAGGAIPVEHTEPSFDLSAFLNGFRPLFQNLLPEQVNELSTTLVQALQGDRVSLSAFITQAAGLASDFERRDAILGDIIANLSGVMSGLARRSGELETLITQTRALIGGLYDQGQSLLSSTTQIAAASESLVEMVSQVQPKLAPVQNATHDALTLLIDNGAKLDQAAIDLPGILANVGKFTQDGAYASAYVCSLDVSLYGILFPRGIFSQIGGHAHSAVCRP